MRQMLLMAVVLAGLTAGFAGGATLPRPGVDDAGRTAARAAGATTTAGATTAAAAGKTWPIERASAEDQATFAGIKRWALAEAAKKPLILAESEESYFFIMGPRAEMLMDAYAYCGDAALLEAFVPLMEQILSQRYVHPKEPKVWSGWWHYKMGEADSALHYMVIHGATLYYAPALKFVMAVRNDAALRARYGAKAEAWFKDITEVEIPAWDKRGCWHDLGAKGGWYTKTTHYPDAKTGELKQRTDVYQGASYAYNKVHALVQSLCLAYRLTGEARYKARIEACEKWFRGHWRVDAQHAEWNYRDFSGLWDYKNGRDGATKTGYWIHEKGGYYWADTMAIVDCYDVGLGFTKPDLEKLLQTNLEFMWMGDAKDPKFKQINGKYEAAGKYGKGYLWRPLGHFSTKVRELWKAQLDRDRGQYGWESDMLGYLLETAQPVSWEARHVSEIAKKR